MSCLYYGLRVQSPRSVQCDRNNYIVIIIRHIHEYVTYTRVYYNNVAEP